METFERISLSDCDAYVSPTHNGDVWISLSQPGGESHTLTVHSDGKLTFEQTKEGKVGEYRDTGSLVTWGLEFFRSMRKVALWKRVLLRLSLGKHNYSMIVSMSRDLQKKLGGKYISEDGFGTLIVQEVLPDPWH